MAITDAYATAEDLKTAMGAKIGAKDDLLEEVLLAVSRYMDRSLHQSFTKEAAAVAMTYIPACTGRSLTIANVAELTNFAIKVDEDRDGSFTDETAWNAGDYELRPLNAAIGPEPQPWNEIYVPSWSTKNGFLSGLRVQVTAIWGWPSVPMAVKQACIELAKLWLVKGPRATQQLVELDSELAVSGAAMGILKRVQYAYWAPVFA